MKVSLEASSSARWVDVPLVAIYGAVLLMVVWMPVLVSSEVVCIAMGTIMRYWWTVDNKTLFKSRRGKVAASRAIRCTLLGQAKQVFVCFYDARKTFNMGRVCVFYIHQFPLSCASTISIAAERKPPLCRYLRCRAVGENFMRFEAQASVRGHPAKLQKDKPMQAAASRLFERGKFDTSPLRWYYISLLEESSVEEDTGCGRIIRRAARTIKGPLTN